VATSRGLNIPPPLGIGVVDVGVLNKRTDDGQRLNSRQIGVATQLDVPPGTFNDVIKLMERAICSCVSHDLWALSYPPARRWECHRCGLIIEDVSTAQMDRRRFPRDKTRNTSGTDQA